MTGDQRQKHDIAVDEARRAAWWRQFVRASQAWGCEDMTFAEADAAQQMRAQRVEPVEAARRLYGAPAG